MGMTQGTLIPAYGRDYGSKVEVITDFREGKDFIYNNIASPYHNKYCNIRDCGPGELIKLRYDKKRKVCFYTVTDSDIRSL
jgi:hypothetical protein